jgi:outer membrane protein assembly factor BamA
MNKVGILALAAAIGLASAAAVKAQTGKLVAIQAEGSRRFPAAKIVVASGLHVGDTVGREELQAAADRLAQLGTFSSVQYKFSSRAEDVTLEFHLEDAPRLPVSFDNFPWFSDAELTQALEEALVLFDGAAPEQGTILESMAETLGRLLRSHGINARVEHRLIGQPGAEGMVQQFRVEGASLRVSAVQFQDALATEDKRVRQVLGELLGKAYSRFTIERFTLEQVRPVYLEQGYLRVRFATPLARFTGNPNQPLPDTVLVIVPIEPGPAYRWGGASWSGSTEFNSAALDELMGLKTGERANGMKITGGWERVQTEYGHRGYLDATIKPEASFDDASGQVRYRAAISEGSQYRMGQMVITGLSPAAERKLIAAFRLARGEVFDRVYFEEFLATGIKQAFGDYPVHYDRVGHWLRTNPENKTVDVLLDFQ